MGEVDGIRLERVVALPREVVWEALVDPVLVSGWLHPDARLVEGATPVLYIEPETPTGRAVLEVVSPVFGEVRLELVPVPDGPRGESTRLAVWARGEWGSLANRRRFWTARLDRLESLLRGHPADWSEDAHPQGRPEPPAHMSNAPRGC